MYPSSESSSPWQAKQQGSSRSVASSSSWQASLADTDDDEEEDARRRRHPCGDSMEETAHRLTSLSMGNTSSRQGSSSRSNTPRSSAAFGAIAPPCTYPTAPSTRAPSRGSSRGPLDEIYAHVARAEARCSPSSRVFALSPSSSSMLRNKRVCDVSEYLVGQGRGLSLSVQSDLAACRTFGQQAARRKALATKGDRLVKLIVVMRDELSKDLTKELHVDISFQPDSALLETDALLGEWAHREIRHLTIGSVTGDVARAFAACLKGLLFCIYRSEGLNELALTMMRIGLVPNPYPEMI